MDWAEYEYSDEDAVNYSNLGDLGRGVLQKVLYDVVAHHAEIVYQVHVEEEPDEVRYCIKIENDDGSGVLDHGIICIGEIPLIDEPTEQALHNDINWKAYEEGARIPLKHLESLDGFVQAHRIDRYLNLLHAEHRGQHDEDAHFVNNHLEAVEVPGILPNVPHDAC